MKKTFISVGASILLLTGCANKNVSDSYITSKNHSLKEIFSSYLYQNENKPYLFQKYLVSNNANADLVSDFYRKMNLLCKSRGGIAMNIFDFGEKYKLSLNDFPDRCISSMDNGSTYLCVINSKSKIPKVLFLWSGGQKQRQRIYANYVHTFVSGGVKSAYISRVPTLEEKEYQSATELACLPDQTDWPYFFTSARKAFLEKQKLLAKKKIELERKKKEEELDDGYRRF